MERRRLAETALRSGGVAIDSMATRTRAETGEVLLGHLFLGGAPPGCPDSGDSNDDGRLDLTDAIVLLSYLYLGGSPPPPPGPSECGPDPTVDALGRCAEDC